MAQAGSPIRRGFGRRKWDKQPTDHADVLIASTGQAIPSSVIRWATQLSQGGPIAVVSIARVYGSGLGLPNPGLMPTRKEMEAQRDQVRAAVAAIEKAGTEAWGQVAATRKASKTIARAAKARSASHVLIVDPEKPTWRRVVEGNVVREVARRLPDGVTVDGATP
jgi:K+-sensing histidine kinase KdpD